MLQAARLRHPDASKQPVVCKPQHMAFTLALSLIGSGHAGEVLFIDDSVRNIEAARELGFHTVLVGHEGSDAVAHPAHVAVRRVHDLFTSMPELFRASGRTARRSRIEPALV